eukprot:gene7041-7255_t
MAAAGSSSNSWQWISCAVLSTLSSHPSSAGFPFGSVVEFAVDSQGRPLLATSTLSPHTADLQADGRCSITVMAPSFKGLQDGRFTLTGTAKPLPEADRAAAREVYLTKYPQAFYVDFGDFRWLRMETLKGGRFVGGFGRVASVAAEDYAAAKPDPVASFTVHVAGHMNGEQSHVQDMIAMVQHYVGLTVSDAKMLDMDRLGTTLQCTRGGQSFKVRLPFVRPAEDRKGVKEVLVEMTKTARDVLSMAAPKVAEQASTAHKTPVTIITGFLGAGKTTLLNYILKAKAEKNISVIENEFGEVNIDNELVADNLIEKEDLVSLDNGCVCCSLRKDIVKALAEIERRSRHRNKRVDQVILETTGLADPAPVAFTFFANPWIVSRFRLDSIVCVVDTRYVMQHLEEEAGGGINEIAQQLAFSDLILLNKVDLIDAEQLEVVKSAVRRINQSAKLLDCQLNQEGKEPSLSLLLENNSFNVNKALKVDPEFLHSDSGSDMSDTDSEGSDSDCADGAVADASKEGLAEQHKQTAVQAESSQQTSQTVLRVSCGGCTETAGAKRLHPSSAAADSTAHYTKGERRPKRRRKQLHDLSGVGSVGIVARGVLDEYRFNMFMRDLLAEKAKDIFRCKGVLAVHGYGNQRFVFQGVHETICYGPSDKPWGENETRINQIVFIGRKLDRKALMEGFRTCVWTQLPPGWQEYHDPITGQPYYYNPQTQQKTWARPVEQLVCPSAVTATRLTSMEQPRSCQPGSKRRSGGGALTGQANSSSSTLSLAAAGKDSAAAPGQVAASVKQDTPEPPAAQVS